MKIIRLYIKFASNLNEVVGKATSWLTLGMVLLICFDVTRRYYFKVTSVAFIELEWYLFSMIFLLAAGFTLKHDKHVRVDVFYSRMTVRQQAWVDFLGTLFFLIPFCLMVIYASYKYTMVSWMYHESSPDSGGLPARYLIKAVIPIGFCFLFIQAIALLLKSLLQIITPSPPLETE